MLDILVEVRTRSIRKKLKPYGISVEDEELIARAQATGEVMVETEAPVGGDLAETFMQLSDKEEETGALKNLVYNATILING